MPAPLLQILHAVPIRHRHICHRGCCVFYLICRCISCALLLSSRFATLQERRQGRCALKTVGNCSHEWHSCPQCLSPPCSWLRTGGRAVSDGLSQFSRPRDEAFDEFIAIFHTAKACLEWLQNNPSPCCEGRHRPCDEPQQDKPEQTEDGIACHGLCSSRFVVVVIDNCCCCCCCCC